MSRAEMEVETAKAALQQLVTTALLAARRGQTQRVGTILSVLHGHGIDGTWAALNGMADAVLRVNATQQGIDLTDTDVIALPEWLNPDGSAAGYEELTAEERWSARFLLAHAARDAAGRKALVDRLPDDQALLTATVQLTVGAARTVNLIEGPPK